MKQKIEEMLKAIDSITPAVNIAHNWNNIENKWIPTKDYILKSKVIELLTELLSNAEGEVKDFRQYCLDNIGFVIERGFDADIDGHQEPWFSLEYPTIENEEEKEGREPSNEELALFYLSEELFNTSQPQKGERV